MLNASEIIDAHITDRFNRRASSHARVWVRYVVNVLVDVVFYVEEFQIMWRSHRTMREGYLRGPGS